MRFDVLHMFLCDYNKHAVMGTSYDEYSKTFGGNKEVSENSYDELKKQLTNGKSRRSKKQNGITKQKTRNADGFGKETMQNMIQIATGRNKYIIFGIGVIAIIIFGIIINSISIHSTGGHGVITSISSGISSFGGGNVVNEDITKLKMSDGTTFSVRYNEAEGMSLLCPADLGGWHISVDHITYINMVPQKRNMINADIVDDTAGQVLLLGDAGWLSGVPIQITMDNGENTQKDSYMIRLQNVGNQAKIRISKQVI